MREDLAKYGRPLCVTVLENVDDAPRDWVRLALPMLLTSDAIDVMAKLRLAAR